MFSLHSNQGGFIGSGIVVEMDRRSPARAFMVVRVHPMPLTFLPRSLLRCGHVFFQKFLLARKALNITMFVQSKGLIFVDLQS